MKDNILEVRDFNFNEQKQSNSFNLTIQKETIHAILFQNEQEKQQLLQFLRGRCGSSQAELLFKGQQMSQNDLQELERKTIYLINQYSAVNPEKDPLGIFKFNQKGDQGNKSTVFPEMTVAENIFFGREPIKKFLFFKSIDNQKMMEKTAELLELLDLKVYPEQKMVELKPLEKQLVEMLKALSYGAEIILIDQAVIELSESERQLFFDFMRKLKQKGLTIIYLTKEIEEVFAAAELVTVLKDGKNKKTAQVSKIEYNELALLLMGR